MQPGLRLLLLFLVAAAQPDNWDEIIEKKFVELQNEIHSLKVEQKTTIEELTFTKHELYKTKSELAETKSSLARFEEWRLSEVAEAPLLSVCGYSYTTHKRHATVRTGSVFHKTVRLDMSSSCKYQNTTIFTNNIVNIVCNLQVYLCSK